MKQFGRNLVSAVAPVFGVVIGISVLQAAQLPFPPALALNAWPEWAIFAAVVHTFTALCMYAGGRIAGEEQRRATQ